MPVMGAKETETAFWAILSRYTDDKLQFFPFKITCYLVGRFENMDDTWNNSIDGQRRR